MSDDSLPEDVAIQRSVADQVDSLLSQGKKREADQALQDALRDSIPAMPLRFPLRLVRGNLDVAREIATKLKSDESDAPRLRLVRNDNGTPRYIVAWKRKALGAIPARFATLLDSFGDDALLYEPRLHRIAGMNSARELAIAVELVRPEIRLCASCGQPHTSVNLLCGRCRQGRRSPGEGAPEHEIMPDDIQRAIEQFNEG